MPPTPQSRVRTASGVTRQLGQTGSAALAARAGSYQQVVRQLNDQYPALRSAGQLYAAATAVWQARPAAATAQAAGVPQRFAPGIYQRAPNQQTNYRYISQVSYVDPATGVTRTVHAVRDSQTAMTPAQVRADALSQLPMLTEGSDQQYVGAQMPDLSTVRVVTTNIRTRS